MKTKTTKKCLVSTYPLKKIFEKKNTTKQQQQQQQNKQTSKQTKNIPRTPSYSKNYCKKCMKNTCKKLQICSLHEISWL